MPSHHYVLSICMAGKNKKPMLRRSTKIIPVGEPDLSQCPEANQVETLKYKEISCQLNTTYDMAQ